jgi:glutamate/tyrosine decarboxylase-like PLP-dependent enzyme
MKCVQLPATLRPDGSLGLEAADVRAQMVKDLAAGLKPCAIQLNHGTTGTSSYDPVGDYESLARDYPDLWIHVDGAYVDEYLCHIQCSEIFTMRNEKLHTEA